MHARSAPLQALVTLGAPQADDHLYRLLLGHDAAGGAVLAPPYASVIGTGAPRTGKTRGVAIPAVASFPGSTVVVSVRGDVFEQTKESRRRRGPVAVFDPGGLLPDVPERTGWDLLGRCTRLQFAIELAQSLVDLAVPTTSGGHTDWQFWGALARKLVAPCLFAAACNGSPLADVVRWIQTREEYEVAVLLKGIDTDEAALACQMIEGVWATEDRARSSVYATADAMVSPFESPALAEAVSGGIDVERFLRSEGSTLYVIVPATHQAVYAPIVTSLIGTALDAAVEKAEHTDQPARILVVLDEAGNVGRIPDLRSRATTSMGFGITMMSLFHDVSQLRRVYGVDDAQSILGSHHVVMALRGVDVHTATFFDQVIGGDPDDSLPRGTDVARLRRIPDGHAITMVGGSEPRLIALPSLDDPLLRMELDGVAEPDPRSSPGAVAGIAPTRDRGSRSKHRRRTTRTPMPEATADQDDILGIPRIGRAVEAPGPAQEWEDAPLLDCEEPFDVGWADPGEEPPENSWAQQPPAPGEG